MMRVEQRMQVSDITHSVLAYTTSQVAAVLQGECHRNVRLGYPQSMLETWPLQVLQLSCETLPTY